MTVLQKSTSVTFLVFQCRFACHLLILIVNGLLFFITSCIADVQKDRLVLSSHPGPGNEEELSSEVRK